MKILSYFLILMPTVFILSLSSSAKNTAEIAMLTAEEKAWIAAHPVVTLAVDNTYPPLNFEDKDGEMTGLSVDIINAFAKKVGIIFDYRGSIWSIAIKKALDHEVDGVVNADATEERKARLNFTAPYVTLPIGLVTEKGAKDLESLSELKGKLVCAKSNSSHLDLLKKKTKAHLIPIETLEQGIEKVIKGEAFGVFDDVTVLGHLIAEYNFVNLKINLIHHDDIVGVSRLGLRNDDPVMLSVFNKAIASLTMKEKADIQSRWLSLVKEKTVIERHFDWSVFLKIGGPILGLALLFYVIVLLHNKRLRLVVKSRTRELEKSREQFKALLEQAADALFVYDLEGRFLMVNRQACESLGYRSDELLGLSVFDVDVSIHNRDEVKRKWKGLTMSDQSLTIEGLHQRKNGETFPVEVRIGFIEAEEQAAILALVRDITMRRREEQIRMLLSAVIEQAYEIVLITDKKGLIQYVNQAFEKITGYSRDEVIGQTPRLLKSGKHDDEFYIQLWETISDGRVWTGQFVNNRKDGSPLVEEATILPVKDAEGEIINYAAIKRDVTQLKALEDRLRQAQKMEAIGNLAGGIAHDFNNLLYPIVGMSEMLLEDLPPDSLEHENVQEIFNAGQRATDLVKQILAFSRQSEHKLMPVRIQNVLKEVLRLCRSAIPTDIELFQDIQADCRPVKADATQIHQVVMNLITNAFHAIGEKSGKITVRLKQIQLTNSELIDSTLEQGHYIMLSVSDTGVGIEPDIISKIFEPYFTTKEKGKGTGLGLAVVYGIVKEHQGDIKVYSEMNKGTTFKVFLPLIKKETQVTSNNHVSEIETGTERILLVDDEESVVRLEKKMLSRLGYQVTEKTSSQGALDTFKADPYNYDLIITDMTMPMMTGAQLAKKILSIRSDIPIIVCTGFSERINKEIAETIGVKGFLMKPVKKSELAQIVRKLLDEYGYPPVD